MIYGPRVLLNLFIYGSIWGGLTKIMTSDPRDNRPMIGASNSVSAIFAYWVCSNPY